MFNVDTMFNKKNINIPNTVSLIRLLLIPFFCFALINNQKTASVIFFLVIFLGDGIDGFLSRKLNQETYFGKIFDGVIDTVFFYSALVIITIIGKMSLIYLVLLLLPRLLTFFRELIKFLKTKKLTYESSTYRRMIALFIFILIFISLFKKDINLGALIVVIANYLALGLEWFFPRY